MENVRDDLTSGQTRQLMENLNRYKMPYGIEIVAPDGDHISKWFYRGVFYEHAMLDYIRRTYPKGMNVIDVGAHVGGHTLFFRKACEANTWSVEPHPDLFAILEKNLILNDLGSCCSVATCCAFGDHQGIVRPQPWPDGNTGMARVEEVKLDDLAAQDPLPSGLVELTTLDAAVEAAMITPVSLIKIDAEGMGQQVLVGARRTIQKWKPAIFIECQTPRDLMMAQMELAPLGYRHRHQFNHTPTYEFTTS